MPSVDEEVVVEGTQEKVGTIRGAAGGFGLASLKLRPALQVRVVFVEDQAAASPPSEIRYICSSLVPCTRCPDSICSRSRAHLGCPPLQAEAGELVMRTKGSGVRIRPFRPQWWAPSWGFEEEGGEGQ